MLAGCCHGPQTNTLHLGMEVNTAGEHECM